MPANAPSHVRPAVAALAVMLACAAAEPAAWVEGEAVVAFKPGIDPAGAQRAASRHGPALVREFRRLGRHHGCVVALVRSGPRTTASLLDELAADPAVESAAPNFLRRLADHSGERPPPSDPLFGNQWGLRNTGQPVNGAPGAPNADVRFLAAQALGRPAGAAVVLAVMDTGIDPTHPDLGASLWTNPGEIPGNSLDDDGNGHVDDIHGATFVDGDASIADSGDHGTHLAGTIAAATHNGTGIAGIAPAARLMVLKVSGDGENVPDSAMIAALDYVFAMRQRGVNVVAVVGAFAGAGYSAPVEQAIDAAGAAGIVFCAAAGNDGRNLQVVPAYPASFRLPNMLVAAATDQQDLLAPFSNFSAAVVDLAAPGVNILSAIPSWLPPANASVRRGTTIYQARGIRFAGFTPGITAALIDCGLGGPGDFPPAVAGNIALIARGSFGFAQKVANATAAGAAAAVIHNNDASPFDNWSLGQPADRIPAVAVSLADGQALRAALPATVTVVHSVNPAQLYQFRNGTSSATAHVAGAVAFAARNFPTESAAQRVARIRAAVTPLAALAAKTSTGGRLNLAQVADSDSNLLPDWWELEHFQQLGTAAAGDPDGDLRGNLDEFRAGTDPRNPASRLLATATRPPGPAGDVQLAFPTAPSRLYQLERTLTLDPPAWSPVGPPVPGTGAPAVATDPGAAAARPLAFYRIRLAPAW